MNIRTISLLLILSAEVVASAVSRSDVIQAAVVSSVITLIIVPIFMRWFITPRRTLFVNESSIPYIGIVIILSVVGFWGIWLGLFHGNKLYYLLADTYHWFIELVFGTVFSIWALNRIYKPERMVLIIGIYGLVLGVIGILTLHLAMKGAWAGAHAVGNTGLWRLDTVRGFPEFILIPVTAALFLVKHQKTWVRLLLWLTFLLLLAVFVVTLKRTMWISYFLAIFLMLSPRFMLIMMIVGGGLLSIVLFFDPIDTSFLIENSQFISYHESGSSSESFSGRAEQLKAVMPYIMTNPLGHGFGAEIYIFWPHEDIYGFVHYIHNLYVYNLLQIGIIGVLIIIGIGIWFVQQYWKSLCYPSEWGWLVKAGLANFFALAVNGLMLVSTHTIFAGFSLGLGAVALMKAQRKLQYNVKLC